MTPRPFSLTSAKDQQLPAPKGTDGKPSSLRDGRYWPMTGGHPHPTWLVPAGDDVDDIDGDGNDDLIWRD